MPSFRARVLLLGAAAYGVVFFSVQSCGRKSGSVPDGAADAKSADAEWTVPTAFQPPARNPAEGIGFVGAESCRECHAQEFTDWSKSHHHKAMAPATEETVLGDFDDATFTHFGRETRFFRRGGEFWVNAENSAGEREDFKVLYTFGVEPLQQYLLEFPGGRLQALSVCWDTRPADEGGQRWFHLYPDEEVPPSDPLHWTRGLFNWNYMCADCHSTNLHKNYDPDKNTYATTWSEINVSCEACHGPGERHLAWARDYAALSEGEKAASGTEDAHAMGLVVKLKEPGEPAGWILDPDTGQPRRTKPLDSTVQVETCAPCHSHRRILQTAHFHGQDYYDTHTASPLDRILYHPDGQINEEVYVYGSFTQSKMFHAGVRCTDCHHPHTMETYFPDNRLCARCHNAAAYDTPDHHHHQTGSTGASCVNCHMPGKYYMVVDWRLDHSIRIPRPDLSLKLGTPNACSQCHHDRENADAWAAAAVREWFGDKLATPAHFGEILAAARRDPASHTDELLQLARNAEAPAVARAAAVNLLRERPDLEVIDALAGLLGDSDPLVRRHAVGSLELLPPDARIERGRRALFDDSRAVRIEAGRVLAAVPRATLDEPTRKALESAIAEFIESQEAVQDHPGGHVGLALLYQDLGEMAKARRHYEQAVALDPLDVPSRINLAEFYRLAGQEEKVEPLLLEAVNAMPDNSFAQEALGRHYVRRQEYDKALERLKLAASLDPERAEAQYFYGVALNSLGRFPEAIGYLEKAHELEPRNREFLVGLATILRDAGEFERAIQFTDKLIALDPNDPMPFQLRDQLEAMQRQQ